jgi:uncharacterized protein YjbI with pentapeptide repeats
LTGANLNGVDFRDANLRNAVLQDVLARDADFRGADLSGVFLYGADLTGADLQNAKIAGADFQDVKGLIPSQVQAAKAWQATTWLPVSVEGYTSPTFFSYGFRGAVLKGADLSRQDLRGLSFEGSDLRLACLAFSDLSEARLSKARVYQTDFRGSNISVEQVRRLQGWRLGYYDPPLLRRLGLSPGHNEFLKACKLARYELNGADLSDMDMTHCDLRAANLSEATLTGTRLSHAVLADANLSQIIVDPNNAPHLFMTDLRGVKDLDSKQFTWVKRCSAVVLVDGSLASALKISAEHNGRLSKADLRGADLSGYDFSRESFTGMDLTNAILTGADLRETQFDLAKLQGAVCDNANVVRTYFGGNLTHDQLWRAKNPLFTGSNPGLNPADIFRNPYERDIDGQHYQSLRKFVGADLSNAPLFNADLRFADLTRVRLQMANLRRAQFRGAVMKLTDLAGADVDLADFRGSRELTEDQVHQAKNWRSAYFDASLLPSLGLPTDHNENVARVAKRHPQ